MRRSKLRSLLLMPLLFLLTACPNPPPAEESCNFVQNSFQRRVSWAQTPIKFYADESINNQQYFAIKEAMEVWNDQFETPVLELVGRAKDLPVPRVSAEGRVIPDGYNGIYVVEKEIFENTNVKDEQARTSISFRGDYIYESDILVDGSESFYYEDVSIQANEGQVQFKSLMIHEFGHALGLGHVNDEGLGSVMYPKLQFGQMRPAPIVVKSADGQDVPSLELPEIDQQSLSCEYK